MWPIDTSLEAATAYDCAIGMLPANVSKKDLAGLGDWLGQQRERCASLKWHEGHTIPSSSYSPCCAFFTSFLRSSLLYAMGGPLEGLIVTHSCSRHPCPRSVAIWLNGECRQNGVRLESVGAISVKDNDIVKLEHDGSSTLTG